MKKIFVVAFFLVSSFILGYLLNSNNENDERFKIYMNPIVRADQYLLDTKTGVVWQLVQDENKQNMWEPMLKIYASAESIENITNEYLKSKRKE